MLSQSISHWTLSSGPSALLLFQAWRAFRTEHPLKSNDKKHNLLLDSCHSLGKGCTASAAAFPHSCPLIFPGARPSSGGSSRLALKRTQGVWTGPWRRCPGPETSDLQASRVTTQTDLLAIGESWRFCGHLSTPSFPHDHILSHILMSLDGCCLLVNW